MSTFEADCNLWVTVFFIRFSRCTWRVWGGEGQPLNQQQKRNDAQLKAPSWWENVSHSFEGWMKVSNKKVGLLFLLLPKRLPFCWCRNLSFKGSACMKWVPTISIKNPSSSPKKTEERIPSSSSVPVVLSVDDDSIHQQIISSVLRPCGYEVPPCEGNLSKNRRWMTHEVTEG